MQNKASQITIIALIPLLMGFTLGCANNPYLEPQYVDPKLKPYLDQYKEYMDEAGYDTNLPSVHLSFSEYTVPHGKRSTAGVCITTRKEGYIHREIYISKRHYDYFNPNDNEYDLGVESLVFHELAHCIHDIDHISDATMKWIKTKKYSYRTRAYHYSEREYPCPHLMATTSAGNVGSNDRKCYEQHHDMYMDQLREIFELGIWH